MAPHSVLEILDLSKHHEFIRPVKRIHNGPDVPLFLTSLAYRDIMTFILQLNHAMVPRESEGGGSGRVQTWELDSDIVVFSEHVQALRQLIRQLDAWIDEVAPDTGPRRYGNVSFRKWSKLVEGRLADSLANLLPAEFRPTGQLKDAPDEATAFDELKQYLMGSFGSSERLDYGTGHELSFVAFLGSLWKLGFFQGQGPGEAERGIVIGVFEPYLNLVRRLIQSYTLEPAGSHGVWGLDDNSFLPYMFGSAQLAPAIKDADPIPLEGSLPEAPDATAVTDRSFVQRERAKNMYFSAVGCIYDVKRGPFGEHSPMLYDISGIKTGWGKINKGMIKMYNAEVLSKFPVIQHFPFGSLLRWERDPGATAPTSAAHTANQPLRDPSNVHGAISTSMPGNTRLPSEASASVRPGAPATWDAPPSKPPIGMVDGVTRAPWMSTTKPPPSFPGRDKSGLGR